MKLLFWPIRPRRRRDRKGRFDRTASWHLRVLRSASGGQERLHVGCCPVPSSAEERSTFLDACARWMAEHGASGMEIDVNLKATQDQLDFLAKMLAAQPVGPVVQVGTADLHRELRLKALALAGKLPVVSPSPHAANADDREHAQHHEDREPVSHREPDVGHQE